MYNSVGWCAPTLQQIEMALTHSLCTFAVYENEQLVGMARLLGDSAMSFYIKDFAVRPDWQSKGVCRFLVENLEQYIMNQLSDKWAVSLELISSKGKERFYEKFGFEQRPCDWDGAGMFKMIRK